MNDKIAMPAKTTMVEVSASYYDVVKTEWITISQDFPISHPDGAPEGQIIAQAFHAFKQLGGFLKDSPEKTEFYMASKFEAPFTFKTKLVTLIHE